VPKDVWDRLKERLENIARNPHGQHPGADRLKGQGGYRIRQGGWRAIYVITNANHVEVIRVGHRREVYRP
jgi:mRNA-degrading endonuclease RelE of RelBE toxin-antitoxin system